MVREGETEERNNEERWRLQDTTTTIQLPNNVTNDVVDDERSILENSTGASTSPLWVSFPFNLASVAKWNSWGLVGPVRVGRWGAGMAAVEAACGSGWFLSLWSVAKWNSWGMVGFKGPFASFLRLLSLIFWRNVATVFNSVLSSWVRLDTPATRQLPLRRKDEGEGEVGA